MVNKKNFHNKFMATTATATLVGSAIVPVAAADVTTTSGNFKDVSGHYKVPVDYLYSHKIVNGITATEFGTSQAIKRVDVAVMIARAVLTDAEIKNAPNAGFKDVPARAVQHINALKQKGYINGKTDTLFESDASITRGEVAMILARTYGLEGNDSNLNFKDVSGHYNKPVSALVANDITKGKTATTFGTTDSITRGELAIFLYKAETLETEVVPEPEQGITDLKVQDNKNKKTLKISAKSQTGKTAKIELFGFDKNTVKSKPTITINDVEIVNKVIDKEIDVQELINGKVKVVLTVGEEKTEKDFVIDFSDVNTVVSNVNNADSEISLHKLLQNALFENYNEAFITQYLGVLGKGKTPQQTIDGIQKVIDEVNSLQTDATFINQLKNAANQVELFALLSDFTNVKEDLIGSYQTKINTGNAKLTTKKDVQSLIYYSNAEDKISLMLKGRDEEGLPGALQTNVTQAQIDEALAIVNKLDDGYVLVSNKLTKEVLKKDLEIIQRTFTANKRAEAGLVANEAELNAALQNTQLKKITLEDNITVTNEIALGKNITLDGGNNTLTINSVAGGNSEGLLIPKTAENVVIENLIVTTATHDDNLIEIYGDATLKNVTAKDGKKAGIYVNNDGMGTITVNFESITTSGNGWDAGIGLVAQQEGSKVIANFTGTHAFGETTAVYTDNYVTYKGKYEVNGLTGYTKAEVDYQNKWTKD